MIESVPMFPLPGVVLFPKTLLPLHIFEPRYRRMTEDALSGARQLVMACITQGRPAIQATEPLPGPRDPAGHPPVFSIAGIGEIIECDRLADGRFNLVLLGRARVRITELPFVAPYRKVRCEVLDDRGARASECDVAALVSSATRLCGSVKRRDPTYELRLPTDDPAALVDACAHHLVIDADERQLLLETLDVGERLRKASEILAVQHALMEARHGVAS